MTESTCIRTVAEVVEALGGPTRVAKLSPLAGGKGRLAQHVIGWRKTNRLPPTTYLSLSKALAAKGLSAPADLWGMEELVEVEEKA